jgi:hypothetical protein
MRGDQRDGIVFVRTAARLVLPALCLLCAPVQPLPALVIGGGGSPGSDCLAVFDVSVAASAFDGSKIVCTDADPLCDADASEGPNGICVIPVAVCVNNTADPRCALNGVSAVIVEHALDNGDPKFDPQLQALQTRIDNAIESPELDPDVCSVATNFNVPIKGPVGNNRCTKDKKKIQLAAKSVLIDGVVYSDRDKLKIVCLPAAAGGCDPQVLFDGTFDRIQRQVFNAGCALSACHDGQTQQNGLLLEPGASYGNLVNQPPVNPIAGGLGWNRVTPGSPDTSYLYRKITGDLGDPLLGSRMPLGKPKLKRTLRDVIRLWIEQGAPANGWVDGTY